MKHLDLRTSQFSFDPTQLGHVYRVQVGEHYLAAWQVLQNLGRKHHPGLPTHALNELLAVYSGGPVSVSANPYRDGGASAILMLKPMSVDQINQTLHLWSLEVMNIWGEFIDGLDSKLAVIDVIPLAAGDLIKPGFVSPLAYGAIPWLVGQAMSQKPLQSSKPIALHQSSSNTLLAWDDPIVAKNDVRYASALHLIEPELKLLRDCDEPFIQLKVQLSQVMPSWVGRKKHAWVQTENVILRAGVKSRMSDSGWKTQYEFPTNKLLAFLGHAPLPDLTDGAIPVDSPVRPIYATPPSTPMIGSGPGPLFLDQACFHLLSTINGTRALLARKAVSSLAKTKSIPIAPSITVQAVVIAAHAEVMLRLLKASETLGAAMPYFKQVSPPQINLSRLDLADAGRMLEGNATLVELKQWLVESVLPQIRKQESKVAVVETSIEAAAREGDQDPKHFIRRVLAEHGVATQFIMHDPMLATIGDSPESKKDKRDFKALNAVTEVLRLSGYFPSAFMKSSAIPAETTVLSVRLDRITNKGKSIYLPVITRAVVGTPHAQIFWFESDQVQNGKWYEFTDGVAAIHARRTLLDQDSVKDLITQSLLVPTTKANAPLILCLDSGLRTFYGSLKDSPGQGLPPVSPRAAVIRIRVDEDIAQISGDHTVSPDKPAFVGQRIGVFQSLRSDRVYYFVSPSKLYNATISFRKHTRYDVSGRDLKDPWQQLSVTEITVIEPGHFATATQVAEQVALLCRNAPMWDGHLKLPSPMHLGAQIANDHPIMEMRRKSDANRQAASAERRADTVIVN
ncbi:RNaseH domain-containing protein [Pseudomonas sp. S2_H01]